MHRFTALLALLLLAVPHGQAPALRRPVDSARGGRVELPVPFAVGERLAYNISWSSFFTAATATVAVREKNSAVYYVTAEGIPSTLVALIYPLYYKADTLLGVYDLLPQRASILSRERGRQQTKLTVFDQARHTASFEVQSGASSVRELRLPPRTQDPLSALYWLRTLDLKPGAKTVVPVTFNGNVYTVQVTVGGRETLGSGASARRAWRITPVVVDDKSASAPRKMNVWVSDDKRRLPLRMEVELAVGRFEMTLTGG
jgi:hypothetical protein